MIDDMANPIDLRLMASQFPTPCRQCDMHS